MQIKFKKLENTSEKAKMDLSLWAKIMLSKKGFK